MPDGKQLPAILWNGNLVPDAASMQTTFITNMPPTHYEVQSFDCQVINSSYITDGTQGSGDSAGKNMVLLVIVSGYVRLGPANDSDMRGFSETFVLVPNPELSNKRQGKPTKEWLIQSQNFRYVV
jgi:NTF2-related export protein 1/2